MPVISRVVINFSEPNKLKMDVNDQIAIIDDRPELQIIKGQHLTSFEIGTFPRHCVEQQNRRSDISRPLHDSFRHTGHGSAFGKCWGNPAKLDPEFLAGKIAGDVQLRSKTLASISHGDRKAKCSSEQYVKERRLTAHKQFAYNKLKSDQATMLANISPQHGSKQKPDRPPAPSVHKTEEGVLIDLSPEENSAVKILNSSNQTKSNICLLDEPIDIPTVGSMSRDFVQESEAAWEVVAPQEQSIRIRPPPYQSPPTYSNTLEMTKFNPSSPKPSRLQHNNTFEEQHDPFSTSHITPNGTNLKNLYGNGVFSLNAVVNYQKQAFSGTIGQEIYENREAILQHQQQAAGQTPTGSSRNDYGSVQVKIV